MRTKLIFIFLLLGALIGPFAVSAEETGLEASPPIGGEASKLPAVVLFHGEECPHCQAERAFFAELKKDIPDLEIREFEIWHNDKNKKLFLEVAKKMGVDNPAIPFTIIGNKYLIGFNSIKDTGAILKTAIEASRGMEGKNIAEEIIAGNEVKEKPKNITRLDDVKIPFFGNINLKTLSLPVLTVVLGTLDGFNPCSMWSLLVLITLCLNTGSRKKVWMVGGIFIAVSSVSYFLFMSAWLNAFVLAGYMTFIRIVIGLIALVAGVTSIREFYTFKPATCEVSTPEKQKKTMTKIQEVLTRASLPAMLLGVAGIAFSVNLVELMCSIGFPVVFTKTLAMYTLPTWKYYFYIVFYVFFYMLDDIIVVAIAGFSMKFINLNNKYAHWSRLIAGILMVILGALFIFKPELLMFG